MHRRPLGRGRVLAAVAAVIVLVGCVLPWYRVGGPEAGLPTLEFRAFDGSGILTFLAALAVLALVSLPYAAGDRPVGLDRGLSYVLVAALAVVGLVLWPFSLGAELEGLLPDRAPGYWLSVAGTLVLLRAAYDVVGEPSRR